MVGRGQTRSSPTCEAQGRQAADPRGRAEPTRHRALQPHEIRPL